ncbi:MAG: cadherin domain-containing protein [Fidelibacterota bacterium]
MLSLNIALNAQDSIALKNDNAQVTEDGSISISVLKNDDIKDKSNLILEIVEAPKFGTAEINGNSIVYTPNPNANGIEVFRYKADTGTASGTAQVRVNVNAVNDAPEAIVLEKNTILENTPAGTVVGALTTTDPDEGDRFSYELARDGSRDNFKINGSNLVTKQSFDFEETATYTVTIQTTDSGKESFVGTIAVKVENENEPPILKGNKNLKLFHAENAGKIVASLEASDPDADQTGIKYKLSTSPDKGVFKITRSGDLSFLREPDFENPIDENKDNVYEVAFNAVDSKDSKLFVEGTASITLTDELETEVKTLDKRKFIAWTVDHQPYHILMEDAIQDYIDLKYMDDESNVDGIDDGNGEVIRELNPTDQIILVQKKDNSDEIHEIWYGNGLDYTIIDREKVDWVFSQDIQTVLMTRDQYLTNDSETVFHESESERLIAGYGSQFSVWHSSNFKLSLSSFSMRSNLLQYAANMRVGNELIGLPGLLGGSSELGVATQRSEFGFRMPFAFDVGKMGGYDNKSSVLSDEYGGLYARGNIENLFSTKADFHGLIGFTFYPSSSGKKLLSLAALESDSTKWKTIADSTTNLNILDSYALMATTVQVPIKASFIGRLTAAPGFHYMKVAHRLKDTRKQAITDGQELYERAYFDDNEDTEDNDDGNSFTRLNSFYIRFDLLGQIGQKPNFIEKLSFLDFIQISKVPFYEFSFQYITGLNMIYTLNLNLSDVFGVSITGLKKNADLKGHWMPDSKFWVGLKYRANF